MKLETRAFNLKKPKNRQHIPSIIELSHEEDMIPITEETIARHHLARVMVDRDGDIEKFAGYAAITHIYSKDVVELGALVTSENYRGLGVASTLVKEVKAAAHETWESAQILAFTNNASKTVFAKLGGLVVENPDIVLPAQLFLYSGRQYILTSLQY